MKQHCVNTIPKVLLPLCILRIPNNENPGTREIMLSRCRKECDDFLTKTKMYGHLHGTKITSHHHHLRGEDGSMMGFISTSTGMSLRFPNFSASLAIWMSSGVKYWYSTLTTKRGRSAAMIIINKHTQKDPSPIMLKIALSDYVPGASVSQSIYT